MAGINDLFNQLVAANGKLDQLHTDEVNEITATNQVKASVDTLDGDVKNLDNDVKTIGAAEIQLLFHLTQQADTMICALEHISKNTCAILTQVTIQTGLQTEIRDDADALLAIEETVNPGAALERERLAALKAQIEQCCPPPQPKPACTYEPCPKPDQIKRPQVPGSDNPK